jgi:CRP/FNR family transcriptional regulator, cyclic AMP receptor protein
MAQDELESASDQVNLLNFERVSRSMALTDHILGLTGKSPFFSDLSREDILLLSGHMDFYCTQPGDIIIRENDVGDFMLLIIEGEVDILKRSMRLEQEHIASVRSGTTLGEMSMIDGEPRFATCVASQPTTFAVLTRANMATIILDHPELSAKILVKLVIIMSSRLRQTSRRLLKYMER